MIKLGSQEVTKIMKGSEEITAVYKGSDEVWTSDKLMYYGTEALSGQRNCRFTTYPPDIPTDSFTAEVWFKSFGGANHGPYASIFGAWVNPRANGWMFGYNMNGQSGAGELGIMHQAYNDTYAYGIVPGGWGLYGWNHVAFVKQSGRIYIYINGISVYSFSPAGYTWGAHDSFHCGGSGIRDPAWGTYSNFRLSKIARYLSGTTFQTPLEPFTDDSHTLILSHCGDEIKDYSSYNHNTYSDSGLRVVEDTPWTPKIRVQGEFEEWGPPQTGNTDINLEELA